MENTFEMNEMVENLSNRKTELNENFRIEKYSISDKNSPNGFHIRKETQKENVCEIEYIDQ